MLLQKIRKHIDGNQLFRPGETLLIAVSGGLDSTALLYILWRLNQQYSYDWNLHVFHLNHGFRGEESREDAVFVEQLCKQLGVGCTLREQDVAEYMKEHRLGAQEAAREVRYQWIEHVARTIQAAKVVIAHHADDQVETILFRLIRGTNLGGLSGMPERRWLVPEQIELIRPLLPFHREELEAYCRENRLLFREDSSNRSRKYVRNRLRLDVLPMLEEINPRYKEHLLGLSRSVQFDERFLQQLSRQAMETVIVTKDLNKLVINREKLLKCDLALQRRLIPLILSYLSNESEWSSQHVEAVFRILHSDFPSGKVHLSGGFMVTRKYEYITFGTHEQAVIPAEYAYPLEIPGTTCIPETGASIHTTLLSKKMDWSQLPVNAAVFDQDQLQATVMVRNRRAGDRMSLLGSAARKKVKDIFIDSKIPHDLRDRLPVVVAGNDVIWLPFVKRSSFALATEETSRMIYMEVEFGEDWREVTHE